ncbi:tail fiber domain-containing protein [Winogradskyella sp. R77965]|uniref:tail fiber domain-containing protein n=1 Tax=Winogradskyella sp. R77965 TaxID=3093872 RepID=UPI0037DCE931
MKNTILFIATLFLMTISSFAQNGINYKAIVKNGSGNVLASSPVTLQFTIYAGAALSNNVYQETHTTNTDANGLIILNVGEGTTADTFEDIAWEVDDHYLNVQVNTGSGLVDLGTTQFKSVPYAKVAEKTKSSERIELPYFDSTTLANGSAFHVHNTSTSAAFGIVGTTGTDGSTIPANRAGVLGYSTNAHGVYGRSENSSYAGVQGVSNSASGYGVLGYGFGGGIGGYFYTTSNGKAALTTGTGNVGIGTQNPEEKMHVAGNLFIQSDLGQLQVGYPGTGNRWALSTVGSGAHLQFRSKPSGSNNYTTRFRFRQDGEFQVGNIGTPTAWTHIQENSTLNKPLLKLEEVGNDYARLELTNNEASGAYWHVAGLPSTTTSSARLNFYFRNASGAADRMTLTGDGEVGINGTPTARLHVHQRSQGVGTGLRFSDNTANQDWDVTHGFALRFHYGGSLRGFISATTGAYTQSSDASLKSNVQSIPALMDRVKQLRPTSYNYKDDKLKTKALGFIAQEVQSIFPEVVHFSEDDGLYGIDYAAFGVIAVKAIQEQQTIIENQQKQIDELKTLILTQLNKN